MKTKDKERLLEILDNEDAYASGYELRELLNEYFNDDEFVAERPELLSLFGQREHIYETYRLMDTIIDKLYYTLNVDVVRSGLFMGTKTCVLKIKE